MGGEGVIKIETVASIPDLQSAMNISSAGHARVKFDFPATEIAQVVRLLTLEGKAFRVTIEELEN